MERFSRRDFLKSAGLLTGGVLLARPSLSAVTQIQSVATDDMSRVVVVTDEACTTGSTIHQNIVQILVDEAIRCYTEILDLGEAWISLFPGITSDSVIGIKVNCFNSLVPSNLETANAITNDLVQMPVPGGFDSNNIIIWDRTNYDLTAGGYTINTGATGVRCFGTNASGVGYDYTVSLNVNGVNSNPSKIFSQYVDYLINLSVIKDHYISGATLNLKNHYGSVNNISGMHSSNCDPYIPSLNQQLDALLGGKEKLRIVDAIFGINAGGPNGSADFVYNGIIMGEDIVAVDHVGLDILVENGMNHAYQATHIQTASEPPYNLGNYNSSLIERVNIVNPSTYIPHNVNITISPVSGPIVIPADGGRFEYTIEIINNENETVIFDVWVNAQLPYGSMFGPVILRSMELPAGGSLIRTMIQNIPSAAPSGEYQFIGRVGEYPGHVWSNSQFPFTKL